MRLGVLMAVLAAAVLSLRADADLASALLAAKNAEERAALLGGHDTAELAAALQGIEKSAGDSYAAKNYPAALNAYQAALALARATGTASKVPFYFRRIGLCQALLGQSDIALATYREGIAASEKLGDNEMLAENLHGAANNLQRMGRYREALPLCEREYALVEKSGQPEAMVRALNTYAQTLGQLGQVKQSLPLEERAVEIARHANLKEYYASSVANLAMYYADLGDDESSLRVLRSIPSPTAYDLEAIATSEIRLHREAEAEVDCRAAIAASTAPVLWRVRAAAFLDLGFLQRRRGRLAEARTNMEQALAVSVSHQDRGGTSSALAALSETATTEKNIAEAMGKAEEALRVARESEDPDRITEALMAQAHALELSGRNEELERTLAEAVSVVEGQRADAPASANGLQGEVAQWMPAYQASVGHQIHSGNALGALRLADRAKGRVLLDMLDGGEPGFDALADPKERSDEQQVRDEVSRARRVAVTKPSAASKGALEAAIRKQDDFNMGLYGRHPELVLQRAAPPDIRPEDLAALMPNGRTALLSYFMLPDSVALFVVRAGARPGTPAVKVFTLPGGDKLDALIRSFRTQIAARDLDYRLTAKALYEALLAPAASALAGTDRWILSPDGALWDVPFQALMDAQGKHVLETHALSYAPSLSVLRELRERSAAPGPPRVALLAVANPAVPGVAPIPEAQREGSAIAALYGAGHATLLAGERASAALFRESAGGAGVIHIALHAETETNHPLESFLLFAPDKRAGGKDAGTEDGALTARDLLGMRLRANLVVLSACETARGQIGQGDGVMGLGWAVLAAGARASVLSQWKVDSGATSDLMIDFHRRLTGGKTADKAEALRQASLDNMRLPGRLHPFYWAAFIVVGDAR
jgi:CHAT domain-containing protein/tetratricopeptide (TPR) repeat protein